jgi:phospholipase D1/2
MIVDDRTAIIGSANINERSQRGDRDSELAVIIRDTDMIDSKMAGFPFKVGRFAHTMRMRLMREHVGKLIRGHFDQASYVSVGVDVDGIARDQKDGEPPSSADPKEPPRPWDPDQEEEHGNDDITRHKSARNRYTDDAGEVMEGLKEGTLGLKQAAQYALGGAHPKGASHLGPHEESTKLPKYDRYQPQSDPEPSLEEMVARKVQGHEPSQRGMDPEEPNNDPKEKRGEDWSEDELRGMVGRKQESSVISEDHEKSAEMRKKTSSHGPKGFKHFRFPSTTDERDEEGHSDTASFRSRSTSGPGSPLETWEQRAHHRATTSNATRSKPYTIPVPAPHIDPNGFQDPLAPDFYDKVWMQVAARNTEIFRKVFRCTPDDRCLTWMQFKEWDLWEKRHKKPVRDAQSTDPVDPDVNSPMSRVASQEGGAPLTSTFSAASLEPMSAGTTNTFRKASRVKVTDEGFSQEELQAMEDMLSDVNGNLGAFMIRPDQNKLMRVCSAIPDQVRSCWLSKRRSFPNRFLESEALAGNNLFTRDRLAPIMIYVSCSSFAGASAEVTCRVALELRRHLVPTTHLHSLVFRLYMQRILIQYLRAKGQSRRRQNDAFGNNRVEIRECGMVDAQLEHPRPSHP